MESILIIIAVIIITLLYFKIKQYMEVAKQPVQATTTTANNTNSNATPAAANEAKILNTPILPEDVTLRRHYLSNVNSMLQLIFPQPTESTLKRHYAGMIESKTTACANDSAKMQALVNAYYAKKSSPIIVTTASVESPALVITTTISTIPEDSTLRRHYITQMKANIASKLPPKPEDSTLRRHYQQHLHSQIKASLAA